MVKEAIFKTISVIALIKDISLNGAGDNSNALANRDAIVRIYQNQGKKAEALAFNIKKVDELADYINRNQDVKPILICVGDDGADIIHQLNKHIGKDKATTILLSHQLSDKVLHANEEASIIAISSHAITKEEVEKLKQGKAKYVPLIGASTSITEQTIQQNYDQLKDKFSKDKPILGVIFGGDAKMPDGSYKLLTIDDAKLLAQNVAKKAKEMGAVVELVDGPRAGAHLGRKDGEVNPVIASFIEIIKEQGININYHPFIMDDAKRKSSASAYQALLKAANKVIYTMESISTGFEFATFETTRDKGIAIEGGSTLPEHRRFAESMYEQGYIDLIVRDNEQFQFIARANNNKANKPLEKDINSIRLVEALKSLSLEQSKGVQF